MSGKSKVSDKQQLSDDLVLVTVNQEDRILLHPAAAHDGANKAAAGPHEDYGLLWTQSEPDSYFFKLY